jgi:hypothetical protein
MGVGPRVWPVVFVVVAVLSLTATGPALAVSRSAAFTIRITRPVAATVNLARDAFTGANTLSGSMTASGATGEERIAVEASLLAPSWTPDVPAAFSIALGLFPDDRSFAAEVYLPEGFDVVATAT